MFDLVNKNIFILSVVKFCFFLQLIILLSIYPKCLNALMVSGFVYEDINRNKIFDKEDKGIYQVGVSNGVDVILTDKNGKYSIELKDSDYIFIIKPSKFKCSLNMNTKNPHFFSLFDVDTLKKESIDKVNFPLYKVKERKEFSAIFLGDIQVRNEQQLGYFINAFMPDLFKANADIYITLGDNVYDNMLLFPSLLETMGKLNNPVYYTAGNHDINSISDGPELQYLTYKKYIGPTYYSFNYSNVHFVILESVKWDGYRYFGEFGEKQLDWLKNDLKHVDENRLVLFIMHIPIFTWDGKNKLKKTVSDSDNFISIVKDFKNSLIIAGHTHTIEKIYSKDYDILNEKHLKIPILIAGATSGNRWRDNCVDELGIPYSRMKDGSPKGYYLITFKDNKFNETYKIPGNPNKQMDVYVIDNNTLISNSITEEDQTDNMSLVANIFNGDAHSKVFYSINDKKNIPMKREFVIDPLFNAISGNKASYKSYHTWLAKLDRLEKGVHKIKVIYRDKNGKEYEEFKVITVK